MRTNFLRLLFGCALLLLVNVFSAPAQTVTGSITGEVADPSGAVIPGARVVAHNLDTASIRLRRRTRPAATASTFYRSDAIRSPSRPMGSTREPLHRSLLKFFRPLHST